MNMFEYLNHPVLQICGIVIVFSIALFCIFAFADWLDAKVAAKGEREEK